MARRGDNVMRKAWFRGLRDFDKVVWFVLRDGLDVPRIPGLFDCGLGQLADAIGPQVSARKVLNTFRRWEALGIGEYDVVQQVIRTVVLTSDRPANYNVLKGWFNEWKEFPDCPAKYRHVEALRALVELGQPDWAREWEATFGSVRVPSEVLSAMTASAPPPTPAAQPPQAPPPERRAEGPTGGNPGGTVTPGVTPQVPSLAEETAPPVASVATEPTPQPQGQPLSVGSPSPSPASDHPISNLSCADDQGSGDPDARERGQAGSPEGTVPELTPQPPGEPLPPAAGEPEGEPFHLDAPGTAPAESSLPELDRARPEIFAAALAERVGGSGPLDDQALGDAAVQVLTEIGGKAFQTDTSSYERRRLGEVFRDRKYTLEKWVLFVLWVRELGPLAAFSWDVTRNGVEGVASKGFVSVRFLLGKLPPDGSGVYLAAPLSTGMEVCLHTLAERKEKARVAAQRAAEARAGTPRARERSPGVMKALSGLQFGPGRTSNGSG